MREVINRAVATRPQPAQAAPAVAWSYDEAFCRNRGLITAEEQETLRNSRVAIAGMGGVGSVHLITLARLGIGKFMIADPDVFELANFNRQYGATLETLGRNKAEVMAEEALRINPELEIRVFRKAIDADNVAAFLEGADVLLDGVDFFAIEARRLIFRAARERGLWAVTAGPIGFSAACLVFDPKGMSFDRYFDLNDSMDRLDQLIAFGVGLAPRATHFKYLDMSTVDMERAIGPSASLACQLAGGVAAAEVMKILLGRPGVQAAPRYFQFDAAREVFRRGKLRGGNRHPWQRFKRRVARRRFVRASGRTR